MDGTGYVITEIVVVLVVVTLIGVAIGWLLRAGRPAPAGETVAAPVAEAPRPETTELELSQSEVEDLRKQLAQAEWRINTLEEALTAGD